ncbi:MAG: cryptochrome/photolyase family protein [Gammaproteobacteria bacterium]|nr:cryptochrome/photolyase family protein [Gammaproteobacteria bacterium]
MASRPKQHRRVFLMLGNQLLPVARLRPWQGALVFMAEDYETCRRLRYHKHKLVLMLAAMRAHAELLRREGFTVDYLPLSDAVNRLSMTEKLRHLLSRTGFRELVHFEIEDPMMEKRIAAFAKRYDLRRTVVPTPMFLNTRDEFADWLSARSTPRMADFYRQQRKQRGLLLDESGRPLGGRWSLDAENRKSLPPGVPVPDLPRPRRGRHVQPVCDLVNEYFPDHPGRTDDFWLPTTRAQATDWLKDFLEQRFSCFGDYEDALTSRSDAVFHSALSPLMNIGLLPPGEVISKALNFANDERIALNSVEGFVRQIVGWREFVRGIYHARGQSMARRNFWGHQRGLTADWYAGTTGILPLDQVIHKVDRLGWAHHIERLMVVGNMMVLCEIAPRAAYRWFMELFVDSAHWVMNPNVYGMALFADGGTFTTKPYICGSNYLLRMGDYERGPWTDIVDGLFWRFVRKHRQWFASQPRLGMLVSNLDRMPHDRLRRLEQCAEEFLREKTLAAQEVA